MFINILGRRAAELIFEYRREEPQQMQATLVLHDRRSDGIAAGRHLAQEVVEEEARCCSFLVVKS